MQPHGLSPASRRLAGVLLVVIPTIVYGGTALLRLLVGGEFEGEPMRHDMWRAGHAHAGVFLVLALVMLRYVDEARLSPAWKWVARLGAPVAAILVPAGFFLSILPPATQPSDVVYLAYAGAVALAVGVLTLGVGLLRTPAN